MTNYCPGAISLSQNSNNPLILQGNTAMPKLKWIEVKNIIGAIDFKLLACIRVKPLECLRFSNNGAKLCEQNLKNYAHIHYREASLGVDIKHYLVVFIEFDISPAALSYRLKNTINWLNIDKEKTFFHIVKYQKVLVPRIADLQSVYDKELKKCFGIGYKKDEGICQVHSVDDRNYRIELSKSDPIDFKII